MKHQVILKVMKGTKGGLFIGSGGIKKNGVEYVLLKGLQAVNKQQMKASDEVMAHRISIDTPPFTFNYEDSGGDSANELRKFFAEAIRHHPQVYTEGFKNPNLGAAVLYEFEDLAMNHEKNFNMEALTLAAKNKAWNMSYREKVDCYYYYGENPLVATDDGKALMDHKQLTIRLCGDGVGLIMRRIPYGNSGKTYLEHFVKSYKANDEGYMLKTTILKAFILKDGEGVALLKRSGNAISLGTEIIGNNIDEAAVWLNNNPEKKKYLTKMVGQSDTIDADNLDEAIDLSEDEVSTDVMEAKVSEQEVRDEAKKLMIPNSWNGLVKNLMPQIIAAREVWKKVDNMGLRVKIEAMNKPNLEKVTKLVNDEELRLSELAV